MTNILCSERKLFPSYLKPITVGTFPSTPSGVSSIILICLILTITSCTPTKPGNQKIPSGAKSSGGTHAVMETDKGTIELELFEKDAPKAVENFRLLAEHGFYDGLTFHRIVKGFMIQGGDPSGDGTGGESAWGGTFPDEIQRDSALYRRGYRRGVLAMANSGPNTNGSQFFIMHQDYQLPPNYVIFGNVIRGLEVVDALATTETTLGGDGAMSKPLSPLRIQKVTIRP
jgi:cyclophilin family peptidyl-prolyl cis-trans isomerase